MLASCSRWSSSSPSPPKSLGEEWVAGALLLEETDGPLDRRTEAILGLAIVTPVLAAYGAIG